MKIVQLTNDETNEVVEIDTNVWTLIKVSGSTAGSFVTLEKLGGEKWSFPVKESAIYVSKKF